MARLGRLRLFPAVVLVAVFLFAPVVPALAQSPASTPTWAVAGNTFTWSVTASESVPGLSTTSTSTSESVTFTVMSVSGTTITYQETSPGSSPVTQTGDLSLPLPQNQGGFYFYIPPSQLQTTLSGYVNSFESSTGVPTAGFNINPTVSQKTVSTSLGDISTWTLDVSGSGSSTANGETIQGSGTASVSYDSQQGLLVKASASASGTLSGSLSGPVSFSADLTLSGKPSSVQLTSGGGGGVLGLGDSILWILVAVAVVVVVVIVVAVVLRGRRGPQAPMAGPSAGPPPPPPPP